MTQYGKIIVHHARPHHLLDTRGVEVMRRKPKEDYRTFMIRAYAYAIEAGIPLEKGTLPSSFPYPRDQDGWILFDRMIYVKDSCGVLRRMKKENTISYGSPHRPEHHASISCYPHVMEWEFHARGQGVIDLPNEEEARERLFSYIHTKRLASLL